MKWFKFHLLAVGALLARVVANPEDPPHHLRQRALPQQVLADNNSQQQQQQQSNVVVSIDQQPPRVLVAEQQQISLDPKTVEVKTDQLPRKRKFLSYSPSEWERLWLDNVDQWAEKREICNVLMGEQAQYVHDFLNLTCTARYSAPWDNWCIIDDGYRPLWYNTINRGAFELSWVLPVPKKIKLQTPNQPVIPGPQHEHIVSKFVFLDETTGREYVEYIEPLVSHLRWPLSKCAHPRPDNPRYYPWHGITFKGFVIPPPPTTPHDRVLYFDAGASDWNDGAGGPSLKFFDELYQRNNLEFKEIYAWEISTPEKKFYKTVPKEKILRTHYKQTAVSSRPQEDSANNPFIPLFIKRVATVNDYIVFKLDIDSPLVETGNIDYILGDEGNYIDEVVWEHHISGNYLMKEWGDLTKLSPYTLRQSYEFFLQMRLKGIRAHSWI